MMPIRLEWRRGLLGNLKNQLKGQYFFATITLRIQRALKSPKSKSSSSFQPKQISQQVKTLNTRREKSTLSWRRNQP
jgi:hypothetical protein